MTIAVDWDIKHQTKPKQTLCMIVDTLIEQLAASLTDSFFFRILPQYQS